MEETEPVSLYVGIGASAGGQEALCEFFSHLPSNTNAAYFVITHLGRYHKSRLHEIIGRNTSMPVYSVVGPQEVKPGCVYLLAENTVMSFDNESVVSQKRIESETINRAINTFLISLARQYGQRAVAIILSGGGRDGLDGSNEIHKHGGTVLVQSPESSLFDSMPNAVIHGDHPTAVLGPAVLAERLVDLIKANASVRTSEHL